MLQIMEKAIYILDNVKSWDADLLSFYSDSGTDPDAYAEHLN
jgi:hypothetical protein